MTPATRWDWQQRQFHAFDAFPWRAVHRDRLQRVCARGLQSDIVNQGIPALRCHVNGSHTQSELVHRYIPHHTTNNNQ